MNLRTKSVFTHAGMIYSVDVFGYVSHGVPGIEIIGLGKYGRSIKEKFIYLTREKNLKMAKRRFVICIEGELEGKKFKDEEFRYLELPIMVMLWSLAGHLPFSSMDDCFLSGKIAVNGEIQCIDMTEKFQNSLREFLGLEDEQELKIVAPDTTKIIEEYYHLSLDGLIGSLMNFEN
jgi:hypothetical protein